MNVIRTDISAVNIVVTIQIEEGDYKERVEKELKKIRQRANVPGFRPGNVPMARIQKMYGPSVKADELNKVMQDALLNYIDENKLEILGEPLPYQEDETQFDIATDTNFEFKFELGLAPSEDISLNKRDNLTYYNIIVTDEMVDNQVKNYAQRFGKYDEVDEKLDDTDMIKGIARELNNEEPIVAEDIVFAARYMQDEEQQKLFAQVKKGDKIVFNPKKAFNNDAEIASLLKIEKERAQELTSDFEVEVTAITHFVASELNEELYGKVYPEAGIKTEEEFRAKVREGVEYSYKEDADYKFGLDAKKAMVKKMSKFDYPEDFLRRWLLATQKEMTEEKLEAEFPLMMEDLKWYVFKNKISAKNEFKVEGEDIKAFARRMARMQFAQYGMTEVPDQYLDNFASEYLKKEETVRNIAEKVLEDKIFEYLKGVVKVTTTDISLEDFNKMFEEV